MPLVSIMLTLYLFGFSCRIGPTTISKSKYSSERVLSFSSTASSPVIRAIAIWISAPFKPASCNWAGSRVVSRKSSPVAVGSMSQNGLSTSASLLNIVTPGGISPWGNFWVSRNLLGVGTSHPASTRDSWMTFANSSASSSLGLYSTLALATGRFFNRADRSFFRNRPEARPSRKSFSTRCIAASFSWARCAFVAASPARSAASAEESWASASSALLMLSSSSFLVPTHPSNMNSPATPTETMIHPAKARFVIHFGVGGLLGFFLSSCTNSNPSRITPIATRKVATFSSTSYWCRNHRSVSCTNGAKTLAISGSFSDPWVDRDVFDKIMALLAIVFFATMIWRLIAERRE
jgi:hypothetical protein